MNQSLKERIEHIREDGPEIKDIPLLAAVILAAITVVGGEIFCFFWFIGILGSALFGGVSKLLMLIPCAILFSVFSSIILVVMHKSDDFVGW